MSYRYLSLQWSVCLMAVVLAAGCGGGSDETSVASSRNAATAQQTSDGHGLGDTDGPLSPDEIDEINTEPPPSPPSPPSPPTPPGNNPSPPPAPPSTTFNFTDMPRSVAMGARIARAPTNKGPFWLGKHSDQSAARAIYEQFTDAQWVDLVPTQAPFDGNGTVCPHNPGVGFSWDPSRPNEIKCDGLVYSAKDGRNVVEKYTVLSGKTVDIPVWRTANGAKVYLQGRIDHNKFAFWLDRSKVMSQAYLGSKDPKLGRRIAIGLLKFSNHLPDTDHALERIQRRGPRVARKLGAHAGRLGPCRRCLVGAVC